MLRRPFQPPHTYTHNTKIKQKEREVMGSKAASAASFKLQFSTSAAHSRGSRGAWLIFTLVGKESGSYTAKVNMQTFKDKKLIFCPEQKVTESAGHVCRWEKCGESFSSLSLLGSHINSEHCPSRRTMPGMSISYFCHWKGCSRREKHFEARYKLLDHIRTHTNEKPFVCNLCNKCFGRTENLKNHIRTHTGARPFICPYDGCSKAYSNTSDRYKHILTHRVQKPYSCKVLGCGKRYTDPSSLRKHAKSSTHSWIHPTWIEERENFLFVLPAQEQIFPMDLSIKNKNPFKFNY